MQRGSKGEYSSVHKWVSVNNQDVYKNEFFKEKPFIADDNKVSSLFFFFYVVLCNLIASFHILWFSLNYPASLVP